MWSSWFTSSRKSGKNQNIMKIKNILLENVKSPTNLKASISPTLNQLQNERRQNVKRLTSIFEQPNQEGDSNAVATVFNKTPTVTNKNKKTLLTPNIVVKAVEERKVKSLMQTFLKKDRDHIQLMYQLCKNYVNYIDVKYKNRLPSDKLMSLKMSIFGPIESILHFHLDKFYPRLSANKHNIVEFSNNLSSMCKEGGFYPYLIFSMDEIEMKYKREQFYKVLMEEIEEKVRLSYDAFAPIQQLAHYHSILIEMLDELRKEDAPKEEIEAVRNAEMEFMKLMARMNAAKIIL